MKKEQLAINSEKRKTRAIIFPLFSALFSLLFVLSCASTQTARLDELDFAIRDASDYLNNNVPAGSKIVILSIESGSAALSDYIIDELISNAVNDRIFDVVERQQINVIRWEQDFQWSGEVDDALALEIGRFFGAQSIITGAINPIGNHYRLTIRTLEVQTARVQGQYNRNIQANRTIDTLMRSGGSGGTNFPNSDRGPGGVVIGGQTGGTTTGGTAQASPQEPGVRPGTYTFFPRIRAHRGGAPQDFYISRIEVRGDFMNIYITNTAIGQGTSNASFSGGSPGFSHIILQNLDRPQLSWNGIGSDWSANGWRDGEYVTFQGVRGTRFSLTHTWSSPHFVFDEIILGEPD